MRSFLQALFAILLAATFAAPVLAATPGGAIQETLTGVLEAVHVDEFATGREREDYSLRTAHGVIPLQFGDKGPEGSGGATVSVTGTRVGKAFRVDSSTSRASFHVTRMPTPGETTTVAAETSSTATPTTATATAAAAATTTLAAATVASPAAKRIAVILVNFNDLATEPFTPDAVQNALTGSPTSLKAFFEEESKGRMTVTGSVFGWYRINAVSTGCDWRTWHTLGWNAATAAGVDLTGFTNVVFIWPQTAQCAFAGMAYTPGNYSYLNGTISVQVMTHEVGHNLGLAHANARQCTVNGTRVTLADNASCKTVAYADPFSTMGNNALRHNHGSQLGELGWLDPGQVVVGAPGNTYTITPYFGPDGIKLVRIPRGDGTFFDLDVRTPYGSFDTFAAGSPAVNGVTIRIGAGTASPTSSSTATELLDTTPATGDLNDAPLLVGRTMTDPVSSISLTTMSISPAGAVVWVREGIAPGTPASLTATATASFSVDLAWTAASDNVAVGAYQVVRDGTLVMTTEATATTWTDAGAAPGALHTYAVAAVDTSGSVGAAVTTSVEVPAAPGGVTVPVPAAATPLADAIRPTVPTRVRVVSRSGTYVTFAWRASTDNVGVTRYLIFRSGRSKPVASTTSPRVRIRTAYRAKYYVRAVDVAGNRSGVSARVRGR